MFVAYLSENYKSDKLLLNWKELALDNKKMTTFSFIRLLKEAGVVPN